MKKQGTEELWRVCFNDSDEFIRLYFDEVYKDENTLVIEERGKIISALQLLPYSIWIEGKEIPIAYICGVSTHPDERGKGYMNQLMKEAEELLIDRNIPLVTLIPQEPWLINIYGKFGYTEAFFYSTETYYPSGSVLTDSYSIHIADLTTPELYPYFDKKLKERSACVLHTEADFQVIRKDIEIGDGKVFVAKNEEEKIVGMAFAVPGNEDDVFIIELLFNDDLAKEHLLHFTAQFYNAKKILYTTLPKPGEEKSKGMAKVIDRDYFKRLNIDINALFSEKRAYMTLMLD